MRRVALLGLLAGCFSSPVETPTTHVTEQVPIVVPQNRHNQIDVLVMVDNSSSMDPMQKELHDRFGEFLAAFDALAQKSPPIYADLHLGVVTSDYGAGRAGAVTSNGKSCQPAGGGQSAKLQTLPEPHVQLAQPCAPPGGGVNFIQYDYAPGGKNNLPAGLTLPQAFTCMASVGSGGCGFEHQLESVYQALHDTTIVENRGFLRPDATLAVVFVTNEDDGSAPADTDIWEFSTNRQLFFDTFYQTWYGIECGSPLMNVPYGSSNGPLAGCVAAGREFDPKRYIDFFNKPESAGGVKFDPQSVVLIGIDALVPPEGPQIVLGLKSNPPQGIIDYAPCSAIDPTTSCLPRLQHACHVGNFFGDPAVRLNTVISAAPNSVIASICDADWSASMQKAAGQIIDHLPKGCIPAPVVDPMHPDCEVEDHTIGSDGIPLPVVVIPRCDGAPAGATCWSAQVIAECAPDQPRGSPQSLGVVIDRHGMDAPPSTSTRVTCSTIADTK